MKKIKVAVLMGGRSPEYEISLISGREVVAHLPRKYAVTPVIISRVDFILKNDKHPVILEINTIPGFTPMSLLPKAAKASGLSYPQMLDKIIKYAFE